MSLLTPSNVQRMGRWGRGRMWIFQDVEERSQNANLGTECQGEMDVMKDDRTYVQKQFPEIPTV